ncbi:Oligosaccharide 4-alpha-D-glucosyltransferase [Flavobacterium sp. 9AF]|uniref:TIM-barrel domain-containing protein n=1 Tax=Flavobacterium sp. 9AF TaxID=2653142 RepID=UPI0012F0BB0E|nr:TIM-barrel domain-containing protein [Flavobacterium sp. 9AF]VXC26716.1 Oligosaccharide 4-alpha-D-glucosyltransferase [Flavobacterium sp. 9AF]
MKKILIILFISIFSFAQNANRKFIELQQKEGNINILTNEGTYAFQYITDEIIETSFIPKNEKFNPYSYAKVLNNASFPNKILETEKEIKIETPRIKILIIKNPFQILYLDNQNQLIISEKEGYKKNDSIESICFNLTKEEILYGGGARVLGMNRRGNRLQLYNRAHYGYETKSELMNFTLPIVVSSKKYILHFDNAPIGFLDLDSKKDNTLSYETISGRKTYQLIVGNNWENLISNYTKLTGKQPLPPRWALGNFSSRFGYHSETEARKVIQKFKEDAIPVDAIILDLYWFGKDIKGTMGNLEIFKDSFPNFEKMVADFEAQGIKTITITEPFILTNANKWNEAKSKKLLTTTIEGLPATWDFYFGNTGLIDVFNTEAKNWFWNIYKELHQKGIKGIWGDLGEPEVFPSYALTAAGKADEVHNVYGHEWAKLIFEGYQKDFPNERPFILMRAGAAGSQRFGMIPWSGDVNRSWGGLSGQPEIALQMGLQGFGYMHSDLGGFAGANLDDELYVRWLQYGVFNPIFRPHAQEDVASEPIFRSERAKELAKCAIELRYQLLPYNYNLAFENTQTGKPLMRPLFFEEDNNEVLLTKADGYLWGNDFLIYPILEAGQKSKEIYFPQTTNWYNFYTEQKHKGGTTQTVEVNENHIPTYIRAGSFIPMAKLVQTTDNYSLNEFDLHFYFDESIKVSSGKLFNDDGLTTNTFEDKKFEKLTFRSKFKNGKIEIRLESDYEMISTFNKEVTLKVHNISKKPKKVRLDNKKVKYTWNSSRSILELKSHLINDKKVQIDIQL